MSRWKGLPEDLDPTIRQLVAQLRGLKDHSGLSLARLADRTGYSRSSWERYLNGRTMPPGEAVEKLAEAAGTDPTRPLALHEVAAEAWSRTGRESEPDTPDTPDTPEPPPGRHRASRASRPSVVAAAVAVAAVLAAGGVLLAVQPWQDDGDPPRATAPAATGSYRCELTKDAGKWYAGNSRTQDQVLGAGSAGPEVAEAQCLLRRVGFSPGGIDGIYGKETQRAVRKFQRKFHESEALVVDGIVGEHTWGVLRG